MKKAKNIKVGSIVEVPYYCFAPLRSGWNGWLFTLGKVLKVGKTSEGLDTALVEIVNEQLKVKDGKCFTYEKCFLFSKCFDATSTIKSHQQFYEEHKEHIENCTGTEQLYFLLENELIK